MVDERIELLKGKLNQFDVADIAEDYLKKYPALSYDWLEKDYEIPNDDCIRTLTIVKQAYSYNEQKNKKRFTLFAEEVADLLKIPFYQVRNTIDAVCEALNRPEEFVLPEFGRSRDLLHRTKAEVEELTAFLSAKYKKEMYSRFFIEALKIGVNETKRRIEALEQATGPFSEGVLYEMYCRNGTLGYLLFPGFYSDQVAGIKYLRERFGEEDTAHILKNDFWYLYDFKEEGYFDVGNEDRRKSRAEMIETYQNQVNVSNRLISLQKELTPYNYDELWDDFLSMWKPLQSNTLKYPFCPSLQKSLIWTISSFAAFMPIPEEFACYNVKSNNS